MGTTTRRGFLKGLGATLGALGLGASLPAARADADADHGAPLARRRVDLQHQSAEHSQTVRRSITWAALDLLVAEQVTAWVGQQETFTAYDVTCALRAAHPTITIAHAQVRASVHGRMQPAVANGGYVREPVMFPTGYAWRYRPGR